MRYAYRLIPLLALLSGCSVFIGTPHDARWPQPRPLGDRLSAARPLDLLPRDNAATRTEPVGPLTLRQALTLALTGSPDLAAARREVAARESETLQAGLRPNPELEAEVEDIYGGVSGPKDEQQDLSDFSGAEATVLLSQTIELAGKRLKRRRLAETQADAAAWDYEARRLEIITQVQSAFVELLAMQQRVALAEQLTEVAVKAHDTVARRVDAGKVSPIEARRARVALETQRTDLATARETLQAARQQLASFWDGEPRFAEAVGDLEPLADIPAPEALTEMLTRNPRLARWATEMAARRAELELAKANAVPDPTVGIGARYFNETENHSFVLGFSIPVPLYDRNQGNIAAARERAKKAEAEQAAAARMLRKELAGVHGRLAAAHTEAGRLRQDVIPEAQAVYESLLEGFWLGEFDLVSVLDAQQRVFELRGRHLNALAQYHQALAELEGLVGAPLGGIQQASVEPISEREEMDQ